MMQCANFLCLCILFLLIGARPGLAQEVIDISPKTSSALGKALATYTDESRSQEILEVHTAPFVTNENDILNFGYSTAADWVRFRLHNPSAHSLERYIKVDKLLTDTLTLYYQEAGHWKSTTSGLQFPQNRELPRDKNIYFPISLPAGDTATYYLRIASSFTKRFSISILDKPALYASSQEEAMIISFYAGALIIITIYNLFLGFTIRDRLYFIYALASVVGLLAVLSIRGFLAYQMPEKYGYLTPYLMSTFIGLYPVFSTCFNIRILQLRHFSKPGFYLMRFNMVLAAVVTLCLNLMRYNGQLMHYELVNVVNVIFTFSAILAGVLAMKKGSPYAKYYLIAWISFLLSIILLALANTGIISSNLLTDNLYIIGSFLEFFLLSFALADRYTSIQKERNRLHLEAEVLNEANAQKDKLFSIIAHDLRSPLASLKAITSLLDPKILREEELDTTRNEITRRINAIGDVIVNLLEWAKGQMSGVSTTPESFDLHSLCQEIVQLYEDRAEKKGMQLRNNIAANTLVYADVNQVRVILRNLIGNAIKFTPRDGVVDVRCKQARYGELRISVQDSGVGIDPLQIDTIFQLHSTSTPGTSGEKGVGLGLALVKEYVEKNAGQISVESSLGQGSTFSFTLPATTVPAFALAADA